MKRRAEPEQRREARWLSVLLRLALGGLALGLGACRTEAAHVAGPAPVQALLRYNVTFAREPEAGLDVEVALIGDVPREFLFTQPGGVDSVSVENSHGEVRSLPVQAGGITVPPGTRSLRYHYELERRGGRHRWSFFGGMGQGDSWLVAGRAWLIRPRVAAPGLHAELSVRGVDALLPWKAGPDGLYHVLADDLVDSGIHGFGGRRCQVKLPGAVIDVAIEGHMTHMSDAQICEWLRQTGEEVLTIRRHFPYPRVTAVLYPVPHHEEANIFGMTMWSTPPSIALLVGQDTTLEALTQDWVALHEMLHLTHPAILPREPWITEGLATYLTEIARARAGRQSPERSWSELLKGFNMGLEQAGGRTTQQMIDESAPPGIYWVGAYLSLRMDVELRRATGNRRGLEDVLELLATQGSTATVESYGAAVDAVAGRPLFKKLLDEELPRPAFAGLEGLLEELGVTPTPGGVKLQSARDSSLREALDGQSAASAQ